MNNYTLLATFLILNIAFISCAEKKSSNDVPVPTLKVDYPFMIESGAVSRRAAPAFITIAKDSVRVYMGIKEALKAEYARDHTVKSTMESIGARLKKMAAIDTSRLDIVHTVATSSTDFHRLYSVFSKEELEGERRYHLQHTRDGGYAKFTSPNGSIYYSNILYKDKIDVSRVRPDTIGMSKFKSLYMHAAVMLKEVRDREKARQLGKAK